MTDLLAEPRAVPLPAGRAGLWRFTLHKRVFDTVGGAAVGAKLADLMDARARRVELKMNQPATIKFTVPGASSAAAQIVELATDVVAWRWDDRAGVDRQIAQGIVTQSQDTLTEQAHSVAFTCQDYLAMLKRRVFTFNYNVTATDQDTIVEGILYRACRVFPDAGGTMYPASEMNLVASFRQPNQASRVKSGVLRDRQYPAQTSCWEALYNLSRVQGGFDFDVIPGGLVRVFYPNQGTITTGQKLVLEYGATVSGLQRTINSTDYANFVRVLGSGLNADYPGQNLVQAAEAYNADAYTVVSGTPVGLWMDTDQATDVTNMVTVTEKAQGALAIEGAMVAEGPGGARVPLPAYTLTLRPGAYYSGAFNMGDTVTLLIRSGRLQVNTLVQVVGITYEIGDDGQEDVIVDVGRPPPRFIQLLTQANQRVSALERRLP